MRLYLVGHRCQYAVEQMLLTLFPGERPSCPTGPPSAQIGENTLLSSLHRGKTWATASARLDWNGSRFWGRRRCKTALLDDPVDGIRVMQRIVKMAFYDAGAAALGREPPWGALTGVRPVKLPVRAMEQGASPRQAARQLQTLYHVSPARVDLAMDCAQQSLAAQKSLKADHVSLYVGIPFCPTRCAYCSFVSADVGRTLKLVEPFVEGLCQELDELGALLNDLGLHVRTVYFGGGTPTTLSAGQLDRVTERLARNIDLSQCTEYTVEAGRPDTITAEKLAVLRRAGVNRISVNPQTMEDAVLAAMGRAHTAEDIRRAWVLARDSGIPCVNMDLIAGLPRDTVQGFCSSLDQVLDLGPENVTVHTLALKKGARLMEQGADALPSGGAVAQMLEYAWGALRRRGQAPYYLYRQKYMSGAFENVGWSQPGWESLYNICMMEELHTILSVGGGGVTKLVNPRTGRIERLSNPKYPQEYLSQFSRVLADKKYAAAFYAAMGKETDYGISNQ